MAVCAPGGVWSQPARAGYAKKNEPDLTQINFCPAAHPLT